MAGTFILPMPQALILIRECITTDNLASFEAPAVDALLSKQQISF